MAANKLPMNTKAREVGRGIGQFVGSFIQFVVGGIVEGAGDLSLITPGGQLVAVPAVAAGKAAQANALVNVGVASHTLNNALQMASTKEGGAKTEPTLPKNPIVDDKGVKITYNKPGLPDEPRLPGVPREHGPTHLHVKGKGPEITIGQAGKPLDPGLKPTPAQQKVIDEYKQKIEKVVDKLQRWYKFHTTP
jgi:hypothetical protein